MRCDTAQRLLSDAADAVLPEEAALAVREHQDSCAACTSFARNVVMLHQRLRVQPLEHVPDVTARVRAQLGGQSRATPHRFSTAAYRVAAVFVAAFLGSAAVVSQLAPTPVLAEQLAERVLAAQAAVEALTARVRVVERGWHPDIPERRYSGMIEYAAPETMRLQLRDDTRYPSDAWLPNNTQWVVDEDRAAATGLRPCPTALQPSCSASGPYEERWHGRAPFDEAVPTPLDIIVPAASFALSGPVTQLGSRTIDGRHAFGVQVSAGQAAPLLDGILRTGSWREIHPTDRTDVWLDQTALIPLAVEVFAAPAQERRLWAAANGLDDSEEEKPILQIVWSDVRINDPVDIDVPGPPQNPDADFAGFVDDPAAAHVVPSWLPPGLKPHRSGRQGDTTVTAWSDGRAWLRVASTTSWRGRRLFGGMGPVVRPLQIGDAIMYASGGGTKIALHADQLDVLVTGSFDETTLIDVAASIDVPTERVPPDWAEAGDVTAATAARQLPDLLVVPDAPGFVGPAVRTNGATAVSSYVGPGTRAFLLTQRPGRVLPPPFAAAVLGVEMRGVGGRYTPSQGTLEWVEEGWVLTLEAESLSLQDLLAIAAAIAPYR